jgi:hypothetical protein
VPVVIGGDNAGHREVLEGVEYLLLDPRRTDDSVAALLGLARDPVWREQIGAWQRKLVMKYDVEVVGRCLVAAYHSALGRRRASPTRIPLDRPEPAFGA